MPRSPEAQKPRSPGKETRVHPVPHRRPAHRPDASEYPLVGAWLLSTVAIVDVSGHTLEHPLGQRPTGLITYTADGHMSVSMLNPDLESGMAAETGTGEPVDTATLFRTSPYLGYAGAYEVMGDLVVHHLHVASLRPWVGTKQERRWKVEGDRRGSVHTEACVAPADRGRHVSDEVIQIQRPSGRPLLLGGVGCGP
ncbi:lipocalin-like domain-containing protein [Streptomyces atratus]|uniref:lipocalin-like domain-containing protein n=1 Tax=Streptomyces atratus TaxID=1893 RepID=UPI0037BD8777